MRPLVIVGAALFLAAALIMPAAAGDLPAPNFRAKTIEGKDISLDELIGKGPILIDFWATWCKPCIKELPYIQRLHDKYSDQGLQVLAVTIDSPKFQSRVKPFIKGRKFTFEVLFDPTKSIFAKMQGRGSIPYVVVLDSEGVIRYRHTGYRPGDEKELEQIVQELLEVETDDSETEAEGASQEAVG